MKGNELHLHLHVLVFIYPKAVSVFLLYDNCVRVFFSPSLSLSLSLSLCQAWLSTAVPRGRPKKHCNASRMAEWSAWKGGSPLAALAIYLSYPFMCAFFHVCVLLSLSPSLSLLPSARFLPNYFLHYSSPVLLHDLLLYLPLWACGACCRASQLSSW